MFQENKYFLFWGLDGSYMLALAKQEFLEEFLRFGLENNFLQGLGNAWFPLNFKILPGFVALFFSPEKISFANSYTIFAFEIFLATLIAGRVCNFSWKVSTIAAWALVSLTFPIFGLPLLYPIMAFVPSIATLVLSSALAIVSFSFIGKGSLIKTLLLSVVFFIIIIYILSSQPSAIILAAPTIIIFALFSLFNCIKPFELRTKLIASVCIILTLAIGPIQYALGILTYTAPYFFPADFLNDRASLYYASIVFDQKLGTLLFLTAAIGVAINIYATSNKNKAASFSLAFCMLLTIAIGLLNISVPDWRGPSPLYFEFMLWPFYAVFSIELFKNLYLWCIRFIKRIVTKLSFPSIRITYWHCLSLVILASWLSLLIPKVTSNEVPAVYPPKSSEIIDYLKNEISLVPGDYFRGRVATFTGLQDITSRKTWFDLHNLDWKLIQTLGNDHRMVGLWFYNIPTLFEYSPLISPAFHAFGKKYFALSQDSQVRNVITMRNIQIKYLQAIGIRFVITDSPRKELNLRVKIAAPKAGYLYLYELPTPNLGQYSPYQIHVKKSLNEILEVMGQSNFDFNKDFVVSDALETKLMPASNVSFYYGKGFMRIKASSNGTSLLALPLEYSHCLYLLQNDQSIETPRIIRINLLQTGLIFNKSLDIKVRYFTGPFQNSGCRLNDSAEFRKLLSE